MSAMSSSSLLELISGMAVNIFDEVTPANQKAQLNVPSVAYAVQNLQNKVDVSQVIAYLNADNGLYAKRLVGCIATSLREILADGQVSMTDAPVVMKLIKDSVTNLNAFHQAAPSIATATSENLVPVLETVVCTVLQLLLNESEFTAMLPIVHMSFSLLQTTLIPAMKSVPFAAWLRSLFTPKH
jgi:hypothetical protein